ncbi:DEAD/DEAH box helicase family protein [Streptomyces sp. CA-111067]|uniref:DEAD/DEAH box helicase family protein n=1 Tax=Streptomyces sp. CA-111067 TaxID=3240046 RepID=UPI003D97500F
MLVQELLTGQRDIAPAPSVLHLRDYQTPRAQAIAAAHQAGAPGFALVSPTGSGKTMTVLAGLNAIRAQVHTVLVVTKLGAVPAWRRAITSYGVGQRWVVINPERLWRLFLHRQHNLGSLPAERASALAAASGLPRVLFDAVVVDESQVLATPESVRSRLVYRLTHPQDGSTPPFFVPASATPFSTVQETSYAADLIAFAAGVEPPAERTGTGYAQWVENLRPGSRAATDDGGVKRIRELLYRHGVGSTATQEELGLPTQAREIHWIELSAQDQEMYDGAWAQFIRAHGLRKLRELRPGRADRGSEALRSVQKASLLKVPHVARHVADLVQGGHQVVVPAWFLDTVDALAADIARELRARGLPDHVAVITGEQPGLREPRRIAFQLGQALVCVTNAVEALNFQAGERDVDGAGTTATTAPRITVFADVLCGGKLSLQAEGRTQRDGQEAPSHYLVVRDTKEQLWLASAFWALAGTQELVHSSTDAAALEELAYLLDDGAGQATSTGASV